MQIKRSILLSTIKHLRYQLLPRQRLLTLFYVPVLLRSDTQTLSNHLRLYSINQTFSNLNVHPLELLTLFPHQVYTHSVCHVYHRAATTTGSARSFCSYSVPTAVTLSFLALVIKVEHFDLHQRFATSFQGHTFTVQIPPFPNHYALLSGHTLSTITQSV